MTESAFGTIEPIKTDGEIIADLADQANSRELVEVIGGRVSVLVLAAGQEVVDYNLEEYSDSPFRKKGSVALTDGNSFVTYVERHKVLGGTTIWADLDKVRVVAVIDDHLTTPDISGAGWGEHRATLTLKHTPDWLHWLKNDGKFITQDQFAEHIEDGIDAIHDPDAATMLEIAQSFHTTSGASFQSSRRLTGEIQFAYEEQTSAKAGTRGTLEIPETFTLGIAPFEGGDPFEIKARFRFRMHEGALALGYRLIRPDKVLRSSFDGIVGEVGLAVDLPVMAGTPRA